jgi:hypothetical protein
MGPGARASPSPVVVRAARLEGSRRTATAGARDEGSTDGDRKAAATALGIDLATLSRKLNRWGDEA